MTQKEKIPMKIKPIREGVEFPKGERPTTTFEHIEEVKRKNIEELTRLEALKKRNHEHPKRL